MKIYTKPDCPECVRLKGQLMSEGVEFIELQASEHMEYLIRKGVLSLPFVED